MFIYRSESDRIGYWCIVVERLLFLCVKSRIAFWTNLLEWDRLQNVLHWVQSINQILEIQSFVFISSLRCSTSFTYLRADCVFLYCLLFIAHKHTRARCHEMCCLVQNEPKCIIFVLNHHSNLCKAHTKLAVH